MLTGEDGILAQAERAKEEEQNRLDKLYGSIKVATEDDAEITINMKDLETIINERIEERIASGIEGINEKSVLMSSSNTSLEVENINLKVFTNTFEEKFSEYFEYDSTTGELICQKDGEYIIKLQLDMQNNLSTWSYTQLLCSVNSIGIVEVSGYVSTGTAECYENNSTRIYLKEGDKMSFSKVTRNSKLNGRNRTYITIIKM